MKITIEKIKKKWVVLMSGEYGSTVAEKKFKTQEEAIEYAKKKEKEYPPPDGFKMMDEVRKMDYEIAQRVMNSPEVKELNGKLKKIEKETANILRKREEKEQKKIHEALSAIPIEE